MNTRLIISSEEKKKKDLQNSIARKQKILEEWMAKVEMLRIDLDMVQREYHVRVGRLLLRDNQLDLEIIQYRNLLALLKEGISYDEAIKQEKDKFYHEFYSIHEEEAKLHEDQELIQKNNTISDELLQQIKNLWKDLIRKFHPDLVTDPKEKSQREDIMKKINKAYAEKDLETLQQIAQHTFVSSNTIVSIETLERLLVQIENMIISLKMEYKELRISEWYGWKEKIAKAKKEQTDVFADLEESILDDIVTKKHILEELKQTLAQTRASIAS